MECQVLTRKFLTAGLALVVSFQLGGCASGAGIGPNALSGAAIGALAGAALGGKDAGGAAVMGAAIGAGFGAYKGCRELKGCWAGAPNRRQYFDARADRYYFFDKASGGYLWENGKPRDVRRTTDSVLARSTPGS